MNWFSTMMLLLCDKRFQPEFTTRTWSQTTSRARRSRINRNFHSWMMKSSKITQICHSRNKSWQISILLLSTWITRTKMLSPWCKRLLLHPTNFSTRRHLIFIIWLSNCCSKLPEPWTLRLLLALQRWQTSSTRWVISCKPLNFRQNLSSFKRRFQDMTTLNWHTAIPI